MACSSAVCTETELESRLVIMSGGWQVKTVWSR